MDGKMHQITCAEFTPQGWQNSLAIPRDRNDIDLTRHGDLGDLTSNQVRRDFNRHQGNFAAPKTHGRIEVGMSQQFVDAVGAPDRHGDGYQPQAVVNFGAARVVQLGNDARHVEEVASDPSRHDVDVIRLAGGYKGIRLLDPGLDEHIPVEANTVQLMAFELGAHQGQIFGVRVDHRNVMPVSVHQPTELLAYPAASHDDHFHTATPWSERFLTWFRFETKRKIDLRTRSIPYSRGANSTNPSQ